MSDLIDMTQTDTQEDAANDSDAAVARLLHLAGPRPAIPADLERRVQARVRREWQQATRRRRVVRWAMPLALAACLVAAVAVIVRPTPVPAPVVGTVARSVSTDGTDARLHAAGDVVRRGDTLATAASEIISIDLRDGTSLRLAEDSALRFDAADDFELLRGGLYADTGQPVYRTAALTVRTPLAVVTDVGTQFLVRYAHGGLQVAVRDGRVDVADEGRTHTAVAGQQLQLTSGEAAKVADIAPHAALWEWAASVAPLFVIENRSLMDFLKWAARETGRDLAFADNEQRMAAMRVVLHGSIADFTPDEAVASVLATSGIVYELTPEKIYIGAQATP